MMITIEDMQEVIDNPGAMQDMILNQLNTDDVANINDVTNPTMLLLETITTGFASSTLENKALIKREFYSLASDKESLYRHLTEDISSNMFSVPSEGLFTFNLNLLDLRQYGYKDFSGRYVETIIPMYTVIKIADTDFTTLNDISIKIFTNDTVTVEQIISDDDIAVNDISILENTLITDNSGVTWIMFTTNVKQITRTLYTDKLIVTDRYFKKYSLNGEYFHSKVTVNNDNNIYDLPVMYNDNYINPSKPMIHAKLVDKDITYDIPDTYILNKTVTGTITTEVYTTKGKLYLPANEYNNNDFSFKLGGISRNNITVTMSNIALYIFSDDTIEGGVTSLELSELRARLINNTSGDIDIPITHKDMIAKGSFNGFNVKLDKNTLTGRTYIASKNMIDIDDSTLKMKGDIFFTGVTVNLAEYSDDENIYVEDDNIVIKSNTVMTEMNGLVTPMNSNIFHSIFDNKSNTDILNYINNSDIKHFINPYYYVVDTTNGTVRSRVYDLDKPLINNNYIVGINPSVTFKTNTGVRIIVKRPYGYQILVQVILNSEFDSVSPEDFKAQLTIPISDSTSNVYVDGEYLPADRMFSFKIETNAYVDVSNKLKIENVLNSLTSNYIDLSLDMSIHFYVCNVIGLDESTYLKDEIFDEVFNASTTGVVVTKEIFNITLGTPLVHLWNSVTTTGSGVMYKKYTENVPMLYTEDVYKLNDDGDCVYVDDDGVLVHEIIHNIGDPVLDKYNEIVYLHLIGDIVKDENGLPVIDLVGGVIRTIDMLLLEYEFKLANTVRLTNYYTLFNDLIKKWITVDVKSLTEVSLENTDIFYKSPRSFTPIVGDTVKVIDDKYRVKPMVIIYSNKTTPYNEVGVNDLISTIGIMIHNSLDSKSINLLLLKNKIMEVLSDDIQGITIKNILEDDNEVLTLADNSNCLVIDKKLKITPSGDLKVVYNIDLKIEYITS